jgi:hypothetical protein
MAGLAAGPRLRGRELELRALGDALDRVASGSSASVLVEGEAGIGKTRLLAETLERARARGMQVAAGRAEELQRTRPFGLVADTLGCVRSSPDPCRAAIAALLATSAGEDGPMTVTSDPGLQFQAVDALVDLVEALALERPLVLAVDDLQWADPSSLLTLGTLGRHLLDLPLALIGCLRPSPHPAELERTLRALEQAGARRLALGQLDQRAVAGLVAEAVAAEPGPGLLAEVAGARGNPLFVAELVAARVQEGAIRTVDGRAEVTELSLPPSLRLTILRRLSLLPERTLEALRAASILGSSFALTDLSSLAGRSVADLSAVLAEAIRARIVEDDGDRLRFRHDLIREAIYQDLPTSVRVGLHREAGRRLAASGAPALRVAEHLARGAGAGDAEAIAWLTRAAREAAPRSPAVAADLLARAVELAEPADPGRDRLLAERAGAHVVGSAPRRRGDLPLAAGPRPRPVGGGAGPAAARPHTRRAGTGPRLAPGAGAGAAVPGAQRRAASRRLGRGGHGPHRAGQPRRGDGSGRAGTDRGGGGRRSHHDRPGHGLGRRGRGAQGEPAPRAPAPRRGGAARRPASRAAGLPVLAPRGPGEHPHRARGGPGAGRRDRRALQPRPRPQRR